MAVTVIRNFIAKALFKKKGAIANSKAVDFSANALEQRIKNFGIDPNLIKNEQELNQVLSYVKQSEDAAFSQKFGDMLNRAGDINAKKGEVFDMTGNKIDTSKGIMGGEEIKPIDELQNYTKSKEEIVKDLVDQKFGKGYFDTVDESEAAIKARIEADNKKGIASMKKKLDDPEEKADGGRIGLKGGTFLNFIKNMTMNKKSPYQFGKDYLKNVKDKTLRANETGKFMDLPLAEVGIPATSGAFINNQIRKKLKAMNEEQKEKQLKNFIMELEKDEFYQKYPDLKDETIASYTEKLFGVKKADGGRIGLLAGTVPKILKLLKNKKKVQAAVDDIFPTGDYKYDAQMAADSLVENNPNTFGGKLYEDLDLDTQMEVYGAVIGPIQSNALAVSKMKKATRPEKTLASMKEGKGINMSDPDIAEEFARFMKETDPQGSKKLEQTVELSNFDPKGRKKNSDGGRIGYAGGSDMGTVSGATRSANTGLKGGYQNTGTGPVERTGGGDGPSEPPKVITRTVTKPDVKNKIKKIGNTIGDISYFKNLINFNPLGIAKNVGGKILMDKILGDESSLNTEDGYDFSEIKNQKADVSATDINRLLGTNPYGKQKYSSEQDIDTIRTIEGPFLNPTITDKEIEGVLKGTITKPTGQFAANGGRIGYKTGSVDKMRRLILKAMGAGTAGIVGAKSGIFSGFGKGAGKTVAKEVAQQTTSSMPPPYFFKLVEKIKMMGDDATATTDRTIAKTLDAKDGKSTYLLEEDVTTGDTIIKKINKEGDEMITDVEIMELKKGETVMGKDGKGIKIADEYEEVTETNSRVYKDEFNDPDYTDGINVDEIIKEVDDKVPSIKYASGGLAYMLGE